MDELSSFLGGTTRVKEDYYALLLFCPAPFLDESDLKAALLESSSFEFDCCCLEVLWSGAMNIFWLPRTFMYPERSTLLI